MKLGLSAGLVTALIVVACGGASPYTVPPEEGSLHTRGPSEVLADVRDFTLEDFVVSFGTLVTWTNRDGVAHTVTSGTPSEPGALWDSGELSQGQSVTFAFIEQGEFDYFCRIHPDRMRGTVRVLGATNNYEGKGIHN